MNIQNSLIDWLISVCRLLIICCRVLISVIHPVSSPMVIFVYECTKITVELIFPMIAYQNRMYGDIGLCEGIIFRSGDVCFPPEMFAASPERWYVLSSLGTMRKSMNASAISVQGQPNNAKLHLKKLVALAIQTGRDTGRGLEEKKKRENARHKRFFFFFCGIFFSRAPFPSSQLNPEARFSGRQEHEVLETLEENKLEE